MAERPRQPEQVEMDLTAEPGEGVPGERADPVIRRNTVNIKIWISKVLGLELDLEESETNARTSAVLQYAIITLLTMGMIALVWAISRNVVLSIVTGTVIMVAGIVFVCTTRTQAGKLS